MWMWKTPGPEVGGGRGSLGGSQEGARLGGLGPPRPVPAGETRPLGRSQEGIWPARFQNLHLAGPLSRLWGKAQTCRPLPSPAPQGVPLSPHFHLSILGSGLASTVSPAGPPSYSRPLEVPRCCPWVTSLLNVPPVWPISPFCEMHADTTMPLCCCPPPLWLSGSLGAGTCTSTTAVAEDGSVQPA